MTTIQKLISFDIGIKNMAFCFFDTSTSSPPSIQKWEVLNLMDETAPIQKVVCTCHLKTKVPKKKVENIVIKTCGKTAKYQKNGEFFCEKHACSHETYLIPKKEHSPASLKKLKVDGLMELANKYGVFSKNTNNNSEKIDALFAQKREQVLIPTTKKDILEKTLAFFDEKCFQVLQVSKKKTANETDLLSIGRNMTRLLDQYPELVESPGTYVILENQISTIANRMKTIQGMLAQYFIMRGRPDIYIEFVSSANKLKDFPKTNALGAASGESSGAATAAATSNSYKQHKKDGITFCKQFLEKNSTWTPWSYALESVKRDDLADSFLQGIWYLKREKIITYAYDLKINSV